MDINKILPKYRNKSIAFIDTEIGFDETIHDMAAIKNDGSYTHTTNFGEYQEFISSMKFLCGHNIIKFDIPYINQTMGIKLNNSFIDTLYLSPLLFPQKPYHNLVKDDKLQSDGLNNPYNDCKKAIDLFWDEVSVFDTLPLILRQIYYGLLYTKIEFTSFFKFIDFNPLFLNVPKLISTYFKNKICDNVDLEDIIKDKNIEMAYALALINANDNSSILPKWVRLNYPETENIIKLLRGTPCKEGCDYCKKNLDVEKQLKRFFGYDSFRSYNGKPLQKEAAAAAVEGKSLLAVFPTGGGKSITFQLPALMAGESAHGLTIVISPLQSLMKDQVDNLEKMGIVDAVTINGMLNAVERTSALERVEDGTATIMYISPEQLRSRTIERLLQSRNIARFVIDEAHCFSAWGQDFRVDYLYIGEFIKKLQTQKRMNHNIPVSCFTATAKQKVISDICDYFKKTLDINLELFTSDADRENLHYTVLHKETDIEKYNTIRNLILEKNCPSIVYVSRTKSTEVIAEKLQKDGINAKPYHGKMEPNDKIAIQEAFISDEIQVIVATSAFGMGVDKKDVKLVIHYDISDSLENYIQEAGRAGRDPKLEAECYILFNDSDLDKHFIMLNQTKLTISEIQQVWVAIKLMSKNRKRICCSSLELAREAGWDDNVIDIETRVKTAIAALENAGYIKRGNNVPHVYADSIQARNMIEAVEIIDTSDAFSELQRENAKRVIQSLISKRSISKANNAEAESRVDYLADRLSLSKQDVLEVVNLMRECGLLADSTDMSAYIQKNDTQNKSALLLERFVKIEKYLIDELYHRENRVFGFKEINDKALQAGLSISSVRNIKTIVYYWTIKNYILKPSYIEKDHLEIEPVLEYKMFLEKFEARVAICRFIINYLFTKLSESEKESMVEFSVNELLLAYLNEIKQSERIANNEITVKDIENAILYLSKIGAMTLEGGFLVIYNGLEINRLEMDNRIKYKNSDYRQLDEYYKQKIRQIHIVGEYANMMVKNYNAALTFVHDYFHLDYKIFISKYFDEKRLEEIDKNITPEKYQKLFGSLSETQLKIINDNTSKYIVVAAGPGSGKTKLLVHKLAALLQMEDVKHEQLLMLTFSRAAANEFKSRLFDLIGSSAAYVEIKTFSSYCFDLLGKIGSLENVENVVKNAAEMIYSGEVEQGKIVKNVLVIDEAQDMSEDDFQLIKALMYVNDDMRVIAVGDDDQNIYEFRGSDNKYFRSLIYEYNATKYELLDNYRSSKFIVKFANNFAKTIQDRMKQSEKNAITEELGEVGINYCITQNMEIPMVEKICGSRLEGSVCVLTKTNEEALKVYGLLLKNGKRARLIQSIDGFQFVNLKEIKDFLAYIDNSSQEPVISDRIWQDAVSYFDHTYNRSTSFSTCKRMMEYYEKFNKVKYRSDLEEFIRESQYDDYDDDDGKEICVSTIHKSKGREFDHVYIMLSGKLMEDEARKRALYVGITRAKKSLSIYCNYLWSDKILFDEIKIFKNRLEYGEPDEIMLQLFYRDVFLDQFKEKKKLISKLMSGTRVEIKNNYLYVVENFKPVPLGKLSSKRIEQFNKLSEKGYVISSSIIDQIVYWKDKKDDTECWIPMINVTMKKFN